jgi:AcrR family transcriptional regulator
MEEGVELMAGRTAFDLDATEIVQAAIEIFEEQGLDAVSMRTVAARLGVSPVPLYSRVGNKEALLDAMADHVLADVAPLQKAHEPWQGYAMRWSMALRDRLVATADIRLVLGHRRSPYVEASKPLVDALREAGFASDAAVQACRLLIWATAGFVVVETTRPQSKDNQGKRPRRPGGDPNVVTRAEADHLFVLHLGYVVEGIERDAETSERS